jgi:hypothetical protein
MPDHNGHIFQHHKLKVCYGQIYKNIFEMLEKITNIYKMMPTYSYNSSPDGSSGLCSAYLGSERL